MQCNSSLMVIKGLFIFFSACPQVLSYPIKCCSCIKMIIEHLIEIILYKLE